MSKRDKGWESDRRDRGADDWRESASKHPAEHCYHQLTPTYGLSLGGQPEVPAVPEVCCWCPGVRLTIITPAPAEATNHGPSLRFVDPQIKPETPRLLVPTGPRLVH